MPARHHQNTQLGAIAAVLRQIYECQLPAAELGFGGSSSLFSFSGSLASASLSSTLGALAGSGSGSGSLGEGTWPSRGGDSSDLADGESLEAIDLTMHGLVSDTSDSSDAEEPALGAALRPAAGATSSGAGSSGSGGEEGGSALPRPGRAPRGERRAAVAAAVAAAATGAGSGGGAAAAAAGRQRLRHGWMPGKLGAHWAEYYETHARDPANINLAPWVAKVYQRRLKKHAAGGAAAGTATASAT